MNLISALKQRNIQFQSDKAFCFYESFQLIRTVTYKELFQEVDARAARLKEKQASGFVLLCLDHPLEFLFSFLALVQSGCVPVPLPPANVSLDGFFKDRLQHLFKNYSFDCVVTDQISSSFFSEYEIPVLNSTFTEKTMSLQRKTANLHPDACFVQFSSGSTSEPKGVVINHRQLLNNIDQILSELKPNPTDRVMTWLPLYHDMGLIGAVLSSLYGGGECHLMATKDYIGHVDQYLDLIQDKKIHFILGPDFMYRQFSKSLMKRKRDLQHLKVCMSGAELVLPSTTQQFTAALQSSNSQPTVFRPVYGMAEACLGVAFHEGGAGPVHCQLDHDQQVISCGYPLVGFQIKIVNQNHESVPDLAIGEIAIKGDSVFEEYYMNKNQKIMTTDGYYLTGDEGFIKDRRLYPLGRKKDVLISHGVKYFSVDLEKYLYENMQSQIGRLACVQAGEVFIVAEIPWTHFYKIRSIKAQLKKLISHKIPVSLNHIIIVPKFDLPRTTSGKIQRYKVIEKIESKGYSELFYFYKSIFHLLKNSQGLRQ